jgi:hypothetical protein
MKVDISDFIDNKQEIDIRIDYWDTYSLDYTLALIIYPALLRLKETKPGSPFVDIEDVPEELKPTGVDMYGVDNTHHERWGWVLDEMIYAFHIVSSEESFEKLEDPRVQKGLELFGKYFRCLWS